MAVTRLKRKAAKNVSRAKLRVQNIKRHKTRTYVTSEFKEVSGMVLEQSAFEIAQGIAAQVNKAVEKKPAPATSKPVEEPIEVLEAVHEPAVVEGMNEPVDQVVESDPLNKVEGIGPKIAKVLQAAGIRTFADLAASTPEQIREILDAAEGNFAAHDPATWPEQAAMAAAGNWDALKEWQDAHIGGRA